MKKLIFLTFFVVLATCNSYAQIIQKPTAPVKKNVIIKIVPSQPAPPPPPPAATNKTTSTSNQDASVYSLTAARVSIKTGADNKEFPSGVSVWLFSMGVGGGFTLDQPSQNLRNEMKIHSNTEFGLQNNTNNDLKNRTLEAFQREGLGLRIRYYPNLPTDAWKIEGISITLEFKDQYGNLHPLYGNKTIVFTTANGFLNYWDWDMFSKTDANFNPLTSVVSIR